MSNIRSSQSRVEDWLLIRVGKGEKADLMCISCTENHWARLPLLCSERKVVARNPGLSSGVSGDCLTNLKALAEAELMETAANLGKKRSEELVKHVAELNEAILVSKIASTEAAKVKCLVLSDKLR
ncbi:hypothetical protein DKX38_022583 [Salix brachista]|uniref:Uncharacterized protein n=1 Tax=Salix brachista TaxID=2182728 RepID=A0A5N5K304_9ROSI|nr:hypothetical protein DKX38_022583 [Salix brachista]